MKKKVKTKHSQREHPVRFQVSPSLVYKRIGVTEVPDGDTDHVLLLSFVNLLRVTQGPRQGVGRVCKCVNYTLGLSCTHVLISEVQ